MSNTIDKTQDDNKQSNDQDNSPFKFGETTEEEKKKKLDNIDNKLNSTNKQSDKNPKRKRDDDDDDKDTPWDNVKKKVKDIISISEAIETFFDTNVLEWIEAIETDVKKLQVSITSIPTTDESSSVLLSRVENSLTLYEIGLDVILASIKEKSLVMKNKLLGDVRQKTSDISLLEKELLKHKDDIEKKEKLNETLEEEKKLLKTKLDECIEHKKELEGEIKELREKYGDKVDYSILEIELKTAKGEISKLGTENSSLKTELNGLRSSYSTIEKENKEIKERLTLSLKITEKNLEECEKENEETKQELEEEKKTTASLELELEVKELEIENLKNVKNQMKSDSEREIEELEKEILELRKDMSSKTKDIKKIDELKEKMESIKKENQELEKQLKNLNTDIRTLEQLKEPDILVENIPVFNKDKFFYNSNGLISRGRIGYAPTFDISKIMQVFFYTSYGFGDANFTYWYSQKLSEQMIIQSIRYQYQESFSRYSLTSGLKYLIHNNFMRDPNVFHRHVKTAFQALGEETSSIPDPNDFTGNSLVFEIKLKSLLKEKVKLTSRSSTMDINVLTNSLFQNMKMDTDAIESIENNSVGDKNISNNLDTLLGLFNEFAIDSNYSQLIEFGKKTLPNSFTVIDRLFGMSKMTSAEWKLTDNQKKTLDFYFDRHVKDEQNLYALSLDATEDEKSQLTEGGMKQLRVLRDEVKKIIDDEKNEVIDKDSDQQQIHSSALGNILKKLRDKINIQKLNDFANRKIESDILLDEYGKTLERSYQENNQKVISHWVKFDKHYESLRNTLHRETGKKPEKRDTTFKVNWIQWNSFYNLFKNCSGDITSSIEFRDVINNEHETRLETFIENYNPSSVNDIQSKDDIKKRSDDLHYWNIAMKFFIFQLNQTELDDLFTIFDTLNQGYEQTEEKKEYYRIIHNYLSFFIIGTHAARSYRDHDLYFLKNLTWDIDIMSDPFKYDKLIHLFDIFTPEYNETIFVEEGSMLEVEKNSNRIDELLYFIPNQTIQKQFFYMYTDFLVNVNEPYNIGEIIDDPMITTGSEINDDDKIVFLPNDNRQRKVKNNLADELYSMENRMAIRYAMWKNKLYTTSNVNSTRLNPYDKNVPFELGKTKNSEENLEKLIFQCIEYLDTMTLLINVTKKNMLSDIKKFYPSITAEYQSITIMSLFMLYDINGPNGIPRETNYNLLYLPKLLQNIKKNLISIANSIQIPITLNDYSVEEKEVSDWVVQLKANLFKKYNDKIYGISDDDKKLDSNSDGGDKNTMDVEDIITDDNIKKEEELFSTDINIESETTTKQRNYFIDAIKKKKDIWKKEEVRKSIFFYMNMDIALTKLEELTASFERIYQNEIFSEMELRGILGVGRIRPNSIIVNQLSYLHYVLDDVRLETIENFSDFKKKIGNSYVDFPILVPILIIETE